MPQPSAILDGLGVIANRSWVLAVLWHLGIIAAFIAGWRPSRRIGAMLLTLPFVTVALLAFMRGNPFNGSVFVIFLVILAHSLAKWGPSPFSGGPRDPVPN